MHLDLPPDARVQIVVLPAGAPPVPDASVLSQAPALPPRPRRRLLKGVAVLALVGCAYVVGQHTIPRTGAVRSAFAQAGLPVPLSPPPPPGPAAPAVGEMPPSFSQQLRQPPSVTPPPGAPAAPSGKNPFGLED